MSEPASSQRPPAPWYAAAFAVLAPIAFLTLPKQPAIVWFHVVCHGATVAAGLAVHRSTAVIKWPWWCLVGALGLFSVRDLAMRWVLAADLPEALAVVVDSVPMLVGYVLLCGATTVRSEPAATEPNSP